MSNDLYTVVHYGAGFDQWPVIPWEPPPITPPYPGTVEPWSPDPASFDPVVEQSMSEGDLVAEVIRRVLDGQISDKAKELLGAALAKHDER